MAPWPRIFGLLQGHRPATHEDLHRSSNHLHGLWGGDLGVEMAGEDGGDVIFFGEASDDGDIWMMFVHRSTGLHYIIQLYSSRFLAHNRSSIVHWGLHHPSHEAATYLGGIAKARPCPEIITGYTGSSVTGRTWQWWNLGICDYLLAYWLAWLKM